MLLVALTGGIGSGKSTVAGMLARRGALVVDADVVAREVVEPGTAGFEEVVGRFGSEVVAPDGSLDRERLAEIVFHDEDARRALNDITHPRVRSEMMRRVGEAPDDAVVVLDIPLLAEGGEEQARPYPVVVVVEAPRELRLDRLEERGVPRADAEARMEGQATDEQRRRIATHLVDNSGDLDALEARVEELWQDLERLRSAEEAAGT